MLNPLTQPSSAITLFKNVHVLREKRTSIKTNNTCAVDSITHIFMALYADRNGIRDILRKCSESCSFSSFVRFSMNVNANNSMEIYRRRNSILENIFKNHITKYTNGLTVIECDCNVNLLIERILCKCFHSFQKERYCSSCGHNLEIKRFFVDFDMDLFENAEMSELKMSLLTALEETNHRRCGCGGKIAIRNVVFNDLIIIDLQLKNSIKQSTLENLPKILELYQVNFKLFGVIEFKGNPKELDCIGHYVSHILRSHRRWETYDNLAAQVTYSNTSAIMQPQVLFYVKEN